jgi:hypothetical protein
MFTETTENINESKSLYFLINMCGDKHSGNKSGSRIVISSLLAFDVNPPDIVTGTSVAFVVNPPDIVTDTSVYVCVLLCGYNKYASTLFTYASIS